MHAPTHTRASLVFTLLLTIPALAASCAEGTPVAGGPAGGAGNGGISNAVTASPATATPTGPPCGDGRIAGGEDCDGNDLAGSSCVALGYGSGMLLCDPQTCRFDTSMCTSGQGSGGAGG